MANLDEFDRNLIVELIEGELGRLELLFPYDEDARSRRLFHLLRIVERLYPNDPNNPVLARLIAEHNIPARRRAAEANEAEDVAPEAPADEEEEANNPPEAEEAAPEAAGEPGLAPGFNFVPQAAEDPGLEANSAPEAEEAVPEAAGEPGFTAAPQAAEEPGLAPGFNFVPNRIYRSTAVGIGQNLVGIGRGYETDANGRMFYTAANGNRHDMSNPPPGRCFNCDGWHWRVDCPYATGNQTVL